MVQHTSLKHIIRGEVVCSPGRGGQKALGVTVLGHHKSTRSNHSNGETNKGAFLQLRLRATEQDNLQFAGSQTQKHGSCIKIGTIEKSRRRAFGIVIPNFSSQGTEPTGTVEYVWLSL